MINELNMVKPKQFHHLHLVYHFAVPLTKLVNFIPLKLSETLWFSDNFKGDRS